MKDEPAFPHHEVVHNGAFGTHYEKSGMTLRDYFAAKAMQSVMLDRWYQSDDIVGESPGAIAPHVAADASDFADAMLAEREKQE